MILPASKEKEWEKINWNPCDGTKKKKGINFSKAQKLANFVVNGNEILGRHIMASFFFVAARENRSILASRILMKRTLELNKI